MKLHPRHDLVVRAGLDIQHAVADAAKKHELTFAELTSILANCLANWAKFEVRGEREGA